MEADGQDIPPRQNRRFQRFYRAMERAATQRG